MGLKSSLSWCDSAFPQGILGGSSLRRVRCRKEVEEQGFHLIESQNEGCERSGITIDLSTAARGCERIVEPKLVYPVA